MLARTAPSREERRIECPLLDIDVAVEPENLDVLALDAALARLAVVDRRQSRLVELRFFAGLTGDELANVLGVADHGEEGLGTGASVAVPRASG
jgi:hypothetical protein